MVREYRLASCSRRFGHVGLKRRRILVCIQGTILNEIFEIRHLFGDKLIKLDAAPPHGY
jgi:hypothetical protein